jgi:hypothetical protein
LHVMEGEVEASRASGNAVATLVKRSLRGGRVPAPGGASVGPATSPPLHL